MLFVLLIDRERLLEQAMLRRNPRNLVDVVVLELVDVADDLALVGADGGEQEQVLQVAVVAEGRRLYDDLLQELDKLDREVSCNKCFHSDRDIIRIGAFRDRSRNDLLKKVSSYGGRQR